MFYADWRLMQACNGQIGMDTFEGVDHIHDFSTESITMITHSIAESLGVITIVTMVAQWCSSTAANGTA